MGIRDIILLVIVAGSLPLSVMRPFFGLLVFSWLAYMRPADMAWSVGKFQPSMWIAIATLVGVALNRRERLFVLEKRTILLGLFVAAVVASAFAAINPDISLRDDANVLNLVKVVFIAVLTTGLVNTRERARWLLLVIGGSLGLLAVKTMFQGLGNPGHVFHGPGGMIADNNDYGLALVMTLPIVFFLFREERGWFLKILLLVMSVACVAGVLLTRSRGGVVALAVVFVAMLFLSRKNPLALVFAPLALAVVVVAVPSALLTRLRALLGGVQDASSAERIVAWKKAINMFADHPVMGVGPGNFVHEFHNYAPHESALGVVEKAVVPHNTYLHILAESGFIAFALFVVLIAVTIAALGRLIRSSGEAWRTNYATAVLLSILGFMAGAVFLSRTHFDLFYHLIGVSVALRMAATEGSSEGVFSFRRRETRTTVEHGGPVYSSSGAA